ncbi:hypothetical protein LUZ60_006850 [Juncus effusus]|nr:hypothetical protein LUZ60_006850 [Juncus effusus]
MRAAPPLPPVSAVLASNKKHLKLKQPDKFKLEQRKGRSSKEFKSGSNGDREQLVRVVHSDGEFIKEATAPFVKIVEDFFWLRFVENPQFFSENQQHDDLFSSVFDPLHLEFPSIDSYPSGLSCAEIMMSDFEALKLYFNFFRNSFNNISAPIPEIYDPQKVAVYFTFRPHVLAFRIIEVLFAFLTASTKLHISKNIESDKIIAKKDRNFDDSKYFTGQVLKETLLYLGPTFIKVGQSLSTRPDIIGSEICEALSELHDNVPPFQTEIAMKIIELELGCNLSEKFTWISDEPIAAASFGQVYKGCTTDGKIVAIKVQRPDLVHYVIRDIYILRIALGLLRKIKKRRSNISLYADEIGKGLIGELDYTIEASNSSKFLEAHKRYEFMVVPKVIKELTTKRVLITEWINGQSPTELLTNQNATAQLLDLVKKGVQASLIQLLETGILHADPHPGNLLYTSDGRLAFLDFGLICKMEPPHQHAMLAAIVHIVNADWAGLVDDLALMDVVPPRTNLRRVTLDLEDALGEVAFNDGIPDIKFSKVLGKIWSVALKYHFKMPPYFTLVLRSLASLEGLALAGDPNFKTFQAAYPYVVNKLLYDNSLATRKIFFSAVLNRKRELQLNKVLLFLRLSSMRNSKFPDEFKLSLGLKLLTQKDGVVIRRLLMTAEGKSLARSFISKDSLFFRQFLIKNFADAIYQFIIKKSNGKFINKTLLNKQTESLSTLNVTLKDRRLKVIFFKFLNDLKTNPFLAVRFTAVLFTVFCYSVGKAMHQFVVDLSEVYLTDFSFGSKQQMVSNA